MRRSGDKATARALARELGIAVGDGTDVLASEQEARVAAEAIGYPVLLKAAGGGGGRGMRVVERPEQLAGAWSAAGSEAGQAFGDDRIFLERYVRHARHVEVQVLGDARGAVVHLGHRDCTLQRRHQKLIAGGEGLSFAQEDVQIAGHAIEVRINAESPEHGFMPTPGRLAAWAAPVGTDVRVDTACFPGWTVPPHYDSLLAKLIVRGADRDDALERTRRALRHLHVEGVSTTRDFALDVLDEADVRTGRVHTRWLEESFLPSWTAAHQEAA
jgi:acetyl/propionyl-CoA carboxylase alpha subunit